MALIEQQASGMSITAFCVQQGLSVNSFSWWKRELKKRDQARRSLQRNQQRGNKVDGTCFIPVNVTKEIPKSRPDVESTCAYYSCLEIVSPNGYTLRIRFESPPSCLTELLDAITACNAIGGSSC